MRVIDIGFINFLLDEKSYKNILIYNISYKRFVGEKPLHIWVDKIGGFVKINNGFRYLVLLEHNKIYHKIRYLISGASGIKYSISYNFNRIIIDSYNALPIEKILAFHNVIILIEPVVYKNKNHDYNIFPEKKIRIKINPIHNNFEWMFCII